MKLAVLAISAAALALAGCNTVNPFAVDPKTTPEVQKTQADAKAAFDKALAARLDHCTISGQLGAGVGGIAGQGTGLQTSGSFNCPAKPWDNSAPAPDLFAPGGLTIPK